MCKQICSRILVRTTNFRQGQPYPKIGEKCNLHLFHAAPDFTDVMHCLKCDHRSVSASGSASAGPDTNTNITNIFVGDLIKRVCANMQCTVNVHIVGGRQNRCTVLFQTSTTTTNLCHGA